jgi:hypothetical protein
VAFNKGSTAHTTDTQNYTINGLTGSDYVNALTTIGGEQIAVSKNNNQTNEYLAGTTGNVLNNLIAETGTSLAGQQQLVGNIAGLNAIVSTGAINAESQTAQAAIANQNAALTSQLQAAQGVPVVSNSVDWNYVILGALGLIGVVGLVYVTRRK